MHVKIPISWVSFNIKEEKKSKQITYGNLGAFMKRWLASSSEKRLIPIEGLDVRTELEQTKLVKYTYVVRLPKVDSKRFGNAGN